MRGTTTGRRRAVRRWPLAFLACLICAISAASASAATLPPEGIFENCGLDTQMAVCLQRLQVMHQGGMQVVVISSAGESPASLAEYAASAQSLGMSVMWQLSDPRWWQDPSTATSMDGSYPGFVTACGCNENGPLLAYLVHWLGQLPGTYGYYAADDSVLSSGDQSTMSGYVAEIKQQDPGHMVMIGSADESQLQRYQGIADLIGTEIYPVTTGPLAQVSSNPGEWDWSSVAQVAADAQGSADAQGKQSAFILQAFTWGDNLSDGQTIGACTAGDTPASCYAKLTYPSEADQLRLRNEVLEHAHPKLILWWSFPGTYGDATGDTYSIYPSGALAAAQWSGLEAAIAAPYPAVAENQPGASALTNRPARAHAAFLNHKRRHKRHRRHHHRRRHRHRRRQRR